MKKSLFFAHSRPIKKIWRPYNTTLLVELTNPRPDLPAKHPEFEDLVISFTKCSWSIMQGSYDLSEESDPEVVDDFLPELNGLRIEDITFSEKTRRWLFQLSDGTQLFADLKTDKQTCEIITKDQTYVLLYNGEMELKEKTSIKFVS